MEDGACVCSQHLVEAKEKGNNAYKAKKFAEALQHYDEACKLDPTNMIFLNNKAAVFFEQKEYDKCIAECESAIELGRKHRADHTNIAKAFARIEKAYMKKEDDDNALRYYTEAIRRNPDDAELYSNRAACYTKLMEFNLALKDIEDCIKLDPKFVQGYLHKGAVLIAMKEPSKAAQAYRKALEIDPNCQDAQDGYRNAVINEDIDPEAVRQRAKDDPEVQQILKDTKMRNILDQMLKDPKDLKKHLENPEIAKKIEKLLECCIRTTR